MAPVHSISHFFSLCQSRSLVLFRVFAAVSSNIDVSSSASVSSTIVFPPLGNSNNVLVLGCNNFSSSLKGDVPFHYTAFDYSRADWDGPRDNLTDAYRRISLNFVLSRLLNFVSWSRLELMNILFIPNIKSSLIYLHAFSLVSPTAISQRNHLFVLSKKINLLNLK